MKDIVIFVGDKKGLLGFPFRYGRNGEQILVQDFYERMAREYFNIAVNRLFLGSPKQEDMQESTPLRPRGYGKLVQYLQILEGQREEVDDHFCEGRTLFVQSADFQEKRTSADTQACSSQFSFWILRT